MPQAPLKTKTNAAKKAKIVRNAGVIRKGLRSYAPKSRNAARDNQTRKLSAQLSSSTELRLATRVGHLELLTGGKRDNKKEAKKAAKEEANKLIPGAK